MTERIEPPRTGLVSAAGTLAVLTASLAFVPLVQGLGWWFQAVLFSVVAVGVAAWARRMLPGGAAALIGACAVPLLATAAAGGGQGLLLFLPTDASSRLVVASFGDAFTQIATDTIPAQPTPALALLLACGIAVAALIVDAVAVALRAPLAAMLVVLALALVPGKALRTGTDGWLLVAVAVAVLLVIAADRVRRGAPSRLPGLLAGGAGALVVALVAQLVLPTPFAVQAQGAPLSPLFGSGVDPLIRLGDNLRRGADTDVLSYTTTSKDDVYLRLAVLESFTGKDWAPNPSDGFRLYTGDAPAAAGLDPSQQKGDAATTVVPTSGTAVGARLPLTYPAISVAGVAGDASDSFRWDVRGLTLARLDTSATVGKYTVQSAVVDTSAARLRNASTTTPADDGASLTVPKKVPAIIRSTAASWTAGAGTPYAKAVAIQNRLRNGVFSYDEQTPAAQGYDGDGVGVIAQFLKVKAGYCVHFASTMALMARLEGIPSRIVVGYQPGTPSVVDGRRVFTVSSDDLHAWPELYFEGVGWVRFEPTPGRGAVPAYAPLPSAGASAGASAAAPSARTSDAVPSAAPSAGAGSAGGGGGAAVGGFLRGAGLVALIAAILALPGLARLALRRRRLRGVSGAGGAGAAWQEVLLTSADLGVPAADGRSPRATEEVLRTALAGEPGAGSALVRLRQAAERQAYGPTAQGADQADVGLVLRALHAGASRWRRVVAAVAPRSLLGTLGPSRLAFGWSPPGSD